MSMAKFMDEREAARRAGWSPELQTAIDKLQSIFSSDEDSRNNYYIEYDHEARFDPRLNHIDIQDGDVIVSHSRSGDPTWRLRAEDVLTVAAVIDEDNYLTVLTPYYIPNHPSTKIHTRSYVGDHEDERCVVVVVGTRESISTATGFVETEFVFTPDGKLIAANLIDAREQRGN
jgi:hypothetical protein